MHVYILAEAMLLTLPQRQRILAELRALGPADGEPWLRNHARMKLDDGAAIVEAEFPGESVTTMAVRDRLAAMFGVDAATVTFSTASSTYGDHASEVATFNYAGQPRFRLTVLGGREATWEESRAEAAAYLRANAYAWGDVDA